MRYFMLSFIGIVALSQAAAQKAKPEDTELWSPVPKVVAPATLPGAPPADAIILFNGGHLDNWVSTRDITQKAQWTLAGDAFMVKKGTGNIQTRQAFTDYQLHIEWRIPQHISGSGQGRGNSGVFLGGWGKSDDGYEIQVLDSYNNKTYANGQAGSIYKQQPPLVNANRAPGAWNVYEIIWTAPRFNEDGSLKTAARITAFLNGVLVQNNTEVKGTTVYIGQPTYKAHGALPIKLQDHGDPSEPISFRNIWVRPL